MRCVCKDCVYGFIEWCIKKIKGQDYHLDTSVSIRPLLCEVIRRSVWLIRGVVKLFFLRGRPAIVFIAPRGELRNCRMIKFGRGVTLGTGAMVDGLSRTGVEFGRNVSIGPYTIIRSTGVYSNIGEGLYIGSNSGINAYSFIGAAGGILIGKNVIMGHHVSLHAENHKFDSIDLPIKEQGVTRRGITIGDDCWIGSNVTILDGSHIGKGCVIGAFSLVNGDIPEYSIAVGVPAIVLKSRRIASTINAN